MDRQSLWEDYVLAVFANHFADATRLPENQEAFDRLLGERGAGVYARGQAWHEALRQVIALLHQIRQRLAGLDARVWQYAIDDVGQQWDGLVYPHFLQQLDYDRFAQYPRYLRALLFRLERLDGHYQKDRRASEEVARHQQRLLDFGGQAALRQPQGDALVRYRWLLVEYRVSVFAQSVGASEPGSGKRLDRQWQEVTG